MKSYFQEDFVESQLHPKLIPVSENKNFYAVCESYDNITIVFK